MAPSKPLVAAFFTFSLADPLDEASMLQMPMVEKTVEADAADCRCPAYFEHECTENAFQGCVWTDMGESNGHWCQCDPNFVPLPSTDVVWTPPVLDPVELWSPHELEYEAVMGSYPGYSGDLHFTGSVSVDKSGSNIILSWHLSGLEAELCASPPAGVGNACGIHIHSGSTCDDSSAVGGHYYHESMAADPWSPVVYTPDALGDSTSSGNTIAIGHTLSDVNGRAIVVHDHTGGRVACGTIHAAPAAKASMGSYPGYSGDLHFTGSVSVDETENDIRLSWRLGGLEAELCASPPVGVGNACGIHIHSGSTCDDSSSVGGHYYHDDMAADPWSPVVYTPDASGASVSAGNLITIGHSLSDVMGRAIVVHDHTGGRVACGIIQPTGRLLPTAIMGNYPGYSGALHLTGSVSVDESGNDLHLSWHLGGLEATLCASPPTGVGNACGIHIHSGSTCDDSSAVGGHYYHEDMAADPWSPVVYTPDALGDSTSSGYTIAIGHSLSDVRGRAIVVHDHTGGRVACGIIQ